MRGLKVGTGQNLLGACHRAYEGNSPGVGVKHRHDGKEHIFFPDTDHVFDGEGKRVQCQGPMRIKHPLGVSRCPRSIAQGRRRLFVEIGIGKMAHVGVGKKLFVFDAAWRHRPGSVDDDNELQADLGAELFQQGEQDFVDDENTVLGMVDDKGGRWDGGGG